MQSQYQVSQGLTTALGGVIQAINDIDQLLQLLQLLGAQIPSWAQPLLNDLLNLKYLLSQLNVNGGLQLTNATGPMNYTAQESWQDVELVTPDGTQIGLTPNQDGGSGYFTFRSPPAYGVQTCSGLATFDKHDLEGALSGIVPPLLDAIVRYETCKNNGPCYDTLSQALAALIDCAQFTPPPPPPDQAVDAGLQCGQDSDCTQCQIDTDVVCAQNGQFKYACREGCRNNYDCSFSTYCDSTLTPRDCTHASWPDGGPSATATPTGSAGGSCATDHDCNNGQPGSGTYCSGASDAGPGTCASGCNGRDNFACATGDVCTDNFAAGGTSCFTLDSSNKYSNVTDTGCSGPGLGPSTDAGVVPSAATLLCNTTSGAVLSELTNFLASLTLQFGVASVAGTCTVQDATSLTNGVWTGELAFVPLTGTFSANQTSGPDAGP